MTNQYNISEIYPNSPLVEVVCEIRFPIELSIECKRNEFYEAIRDNYPEILVPQNRDATAPYRFLNDNKTSEVLLAINRFSFHDKDYKGYGRFINEFSKLLKTLLRIYSLKKFIRLGWRYINVIPFTREDGIVPLNQFLAIDLKLPDGVSDKYENLSIVLISKVPGGTITSKIESIIRSEDQQEALLLDFDFAMTENLLPSKMISNIKNVHKQTRAVFENLITNNYRQYLRGEAI